MTVSAGFYPQDNFPTSFNLRALFGFRRNPQPAWQYQPPSLPKHVPPVDELLPRDVTSKHSTPTPSIEPANPAYGHLLTDASCETSHECGQTSIEYVDRHRRGLAVDGGMVHEVEIATAALVEPGTTTVNVQVCFDVFKARVARSNNSDREQTLTNAFESCCPPCANAWAYNVMVIKYLLRRNWDPTPLLALAEDRPSLFALPPTYTLAHQELLAYAEKMSITFPGCSRQLHKLYLRLAEAATSARVSTNAAQDAGLIVLCRQLWQSSHALDAELGDSVKDLLCTVASKVQNQHTRAALHPLLAQIYSKDGSKRAFLHLISQASLSLDQYIAAANVLRCMPRILLLGFIPMYTLHLSLTKKKIKAATSMHREQWNNWLMLIYRAGRETASGIAFLDAAIDPIAKAAFYKVPKNPLTRRFPDCIRPGNLLHTLLFKFAEQDALYAASKTTAAQLIDSTLLNISTRTEILQPEAVVVMVISALRKASLPYCKFADAIVALLAQHGNLGALVQFMTRLNDHRLNLSETSVIDAVVRQKMVGLQQQTASLTNTQLQHNALTLHNCQKISSILSKIASVAAVEREKVAPTTFKALRVKRQVQHILDRADAARVLPLALRDLSADMTLEDRVALIHQLAHQYSLDRTRSHREIWRAMYYLYRHLEEHSLGIGHLFSRAVVRVSIIRPLSEQRFVSARRLIWVCHLVARVEGEVVAKQIEHDFWQWRGDLIQHAKQMHNSIGADRREKAHVSTMKRLGII
ncbi:hypothetical protein J1614_002073 [Plenodomus biglobosus]|nr:hypothetical protein J1614_002073 [Plenodomus biglobosus]